MTRAARPSTLVSLVSLSIALVAAPGAFAQAEPSQEAVRVYTNADLALLSPLAAESEPAVSRPPTLAAGPNA